MQSIGITAEVNRNEIPYLVVAKGVSQEGSFGIEFIESPQVLSWKKCPHGFTIPWGENLSGGQHRMLLSFDFKDIL
ncbi:MAG TPA: hypothetical protein GXX20_11075 [Clostridiaceae bacterium]|nr:hypothetical protein [Clostridiaceae bacterium]